MIIKILIDILMSVILLFLMSYQIVGERAHEWIGSAMGILFISHIYLNSWWYKNLLKGKYTLFRVIQTIINFLILGSMLSSMFSGIMMSRYVFKFLSLEKNMSFARLLHMGAAYWGFTLMSVHLGLHWGIMLGMFNRMLKIRKEYNIFLKLLGAGIAVHGAYTFYRLDLWSYMLLKNQFVFFDFEQSTVSVLFDYFTIMGLWVFISYYFIKFISKRQKGGK